LVQLVARMTAGPRLFLPKSTKSSLQIFVF